MDSYQFSTNEIEARAEKRRLLFDVLDPYPSYTDRSHTILECLEEFDTLLTSHEQLTIVGRIRAKRGHGGSSFATLTDGTGSIQLFLSKKDVDDKLFENFQRLTDVGDFISVNGYAYTTKKGERSIFVSSWSMLSKTLLPLPEKWHGLTDIEGRLRKRYLDFLMNDEVKSRMIARSKIISAIRAYMDKQAFIEVETPTLQPLYGGGFAKPFTTHHNALDTTFYLRISDEMYLKRLLVGGFEKVYEITKVFRNEGIDRDHNPEFTMMEAQVAYKNYEWGMDFFEELVEHCARTVSTNATIQHEEIVLSFERPWKRMSLTEAVLTIGGIDTNSWLTFADAKTALQKTAIAFSKLATIDHMNSVGELVAFAFEELVEEKLIQPTIIYDYPIEVSPLSKKCKDARYTERFEVFVLGMEIGNNYSELNDPIDLEQRFIHEKKKEDLGNDEAHQTDYEYLEAIKHGMPPACGLGIGIDRLVMMLTGTQNIKEVILFPTLKPQQHAE